jgi:glucan phosphoethanolaminetransferase (alkaline phosphatase superfamily)
MRLAEKKKKKLMLNPGGANSYHETSKVIQQFDTIEYIIRTNESIKYIKGHGPQPSTLFVILGLFDCYLCCSVYCLCLNVYCHRVTTQLQLINIIIIIIIIIKSCPSWQLKKSLSFIEPEDPSYLPLSWDKTIRSSPFHPISLTLWHRSFTFKFFLAHPAC